MDIGQPKRIIEIVPASLPIPGDPDLAPPPVEPVAPDQVPDESVPEPSAPSGHPG